jgi:hypothetical protein
MKNPFFCRETGAAAEECKKKSGSRGRKPSGVSPAAIRPV